jgi:hypothetical protein
MGRTLTGPMLKSKRYWNDGIGDIIQQASLGGIQREPYVRFYMFLFFKVQVAGQWFL